jgi:hypothetical protein
MLNGPQAGMDGAEGWQDPDGANFVEGNALSLPGQRAAAGRRGRSAETTERFPPGGPLSGCLVGARPGNQPPLADSESTVRRH